MASKFNSEFNYRYQVIGHTPWEKIKTLQGFLEGRLGTVMLEEVASLKYQSKIAKLKRLESEGGLEEDILLLKADIMETESQKAVSDDAFKKLKEEIKILKKLLKELYVIAEPTRIPGYSDEEMWEANQANEFTVNVGKEIQAEMIANGRPSAAKIGNAMSNPHTWNALKSIGLVPQGTKILQGNTDPMLKIALTEVEDKIPQIGAKKDEII